MTNNKVYELNAEVSDIVYNQIYKKWESSVQIFNNQISEQAWSNIITPIHSQVRGKVGNQVSNQVKYIFSMPIDSPR